MTVDIEALQEEIAERIYTAIQTSTNSDERSAQAGRWQVGISDLGWCSERTRRMLNQETPTDTDMLPAFIGTAVGDHAERAIADFGYPEALIQQTVTMVLKGQEFTYTIPGHPDVILPQGIVLDGKTTDGLMVAERTGMEERQKKFQRHGYGLAAFEGGLFTDAVGIDDVLVGNYWIDRSGSEKRVLVRIEPYDPEVTRETLEWLEECIYAFKQNQPARKEPPREMCAVTCGFFETCRAYDTDVTGLLTDDEIITAMVLYSEGKNLASLGRTMQEQAKAVLRGHEGFALVDGKRMSLRWMHVNETLTAPSVRRAHDKIEFKELP
jgi:hypothetical protein